MRDKGRSAGRDRVMLFADLLTETGEEKVRVRDLSNMGAMLDSPAPIEAGADVIFRHRGMFAAAIVKWVKDGTIGIAFYRDQEIRPRADQPAVTG
ncbi:PilZ domain-containing protein [Qipengyuania nanhaisediminis]|uniref:PilZ domain-containing protein n=1 Tax=Qipengyuania nanhaisediminis TaxID=604088 RepID=UPI0038B328F0